MELHDISILNLMPANLAGDRNIKMIAGAFDEVLREIIKKIPGVAVIPNLVLNQIVSETLIDLLAWQFHVDFYEADMPLETKRELVLKSLDWHYRKGTPSVIEEIVSTVFSRAKTQEWYEYGGAPYGFRVATEEDIPDIDVRNKFMRAINSVKNTRSFFETLTHLLDFIDEIIIKEEMKTGGRAEFSDSFNHVALKFNGRAKHDGRTINPYEYEGIQADGACKFDGKTKHKPRLVPGTSRVVFPVRISDIFEITENTGTYSDVFACPLKHNGRIQADGTHRFNGQTPLEDSSVLMKTNLSFEDKINCGEEYMEKETAKVKMADENPIKGIFQFKAYRHIEGGKVLIEEFEDRNLIVDKAREQMAHLVSGDTAANRKITKISFGTSGTEPMAQDEIIMSPFTKNMDGFEYPEQTQVKFLWTLGTGEANGKAIREFGLICENDALFARRVRASPLNKEADISLEGSWTIIF